MEYNTEEINHLIRHRRSVYPKQYDGRIVPRAIVEQILENANWAPNHGKTEPWRFFVFEGKHKNALGEAHAELYKKIMPTDQFNEQKYHKLMANTQAASHIIAICMKRQSTERIPEVEEIEAVACAVQNMYLTATAYGVGCYWSSGGATYAEKFKDYFGLGEKDRLLGFFFLGYTSQEIPDSTRQPIADKVTWVGEV